MPGSTDAFGARILIVDDQDSNVRLLELALGRAGYVAVSSTTDGREVAALHRKNAYDLILLDLQMPCMNGFEVMRQLKTVAGDKAAVLVISADPAQLVPVLEAGARGFLAKPFNLAEVLETVHSMLDARVRAPEVSTPLLALKGGAIPCP
jgi:adenylate cyclase